MELKSKKKRPMKVSYTTLLLVTGIGCAGVAALLTLAEPERRATGDRTEQSNLPEAGDEHRAVPTSDSRPTVTPFAPGVVPAGDVEAEDDIDSIAIPTLARAKLMQREPSEPNPRIAKLGPDALDPDVDCQSPLEFTAAARKGTGALGCFRKGAHGQTLLEGRAVVRTASGLLEVGNFDKGLKEGPWESYFPDGRLAIVGEAKEDKRHGVWHEYDERGVHRVSRTYKDGHKHGVTIRYTGSEPKIDLWSASKGRLDLDTREPVDEQKLAVRK